MSPTQQRILVVGGSAGMGLAAAQGHARAGAEALVVGRSQAKRAAASSALYSGRIVALVVACLATGCDGVGDEARREYFKSLELSKTGQPLEEQLARMDRAVQLAPDGANYREHRANILFALDRPGEARAEYDRAVELADRPYLRFERADALCALGEYDAALTDLDRAISAQPKNIQFYPRRALARLAVGRVAEARADVDHAAASSGSAADGGFARAAVLLMEGKPAEALRHLDFELARGSDPSHGALPRTLRMLAHTALGQREFAAAEFDRNRLAAAAHWPDMGYRYWLVPRGCNNAFLATQASDLVAAARAILAGSESVPDASTASRSANTSGEPARAAPPPNRIRPAGT